MELGTGTGLVSLTAGALGAKEVTITDKAEYLFMAEQNLDENFGERTRGAGGAESGSWRK